MRLAILIVAIVVELASIAAATVVTAAATVPTAASTAAGAARLTAALAAASVATRCRSHAGSVTAARRTGKLRRASIRTASLATPVVLASAPASFVTVAMAVAIVGAATHVACIAPPAVLAGARATLDADPMAAAPFGTGGHAARRPTPSAMARTAATKALTTAAAMGRACVLLTRDARPALGADARSRHTAAAAEQCMASERASSGLMAEAGVDHAVGRLPANVTSARAKGAGRMPST